MRFILVGFLYAMVAASVAEGNGFSSLQFLKQDAECKGRISQEKEIEERTFSSEGWHTRYVTQCNVKIDVMAEGSTVAHFHEVSTMVCEKAECKVIKGDEPGHDKFFDQPEKTYDLLPVVKTEDQKAQVETFYKKEVRNQNQAMLAVEVKNQMPLLKKEYPKIILRRAKAMEKEDYHGIVFPLIFGDNAWEYRGKLNYKMLDPDCVGIIIQEKELFKEPIGREEYEKEMEKDKKQSKQTQLTIQDITQCNAHIDIMSDLGSKLASFHDVSEMVCEETVCRVVNGEAVKEKIVKGNAPSQKHYLNQYKITPEFQADLVRTDEQKEKIVNFINEEIIEETQPKLKTLVTQQMPLLKKEYAEVIQRTADALKKDGQKYGEMMGAKIDEKQNLYKYGRDDIH